jgi:2-(1,2-epoxy-1,2-dihydrophenyl)acetyl-CoA isomerase
MSQDVLFERRADGVALITINRPDSLNAMGGEVLPLLGQYFDDAASDREVRCIVLTGAGRAFCSGGDVKEMGQHRAAMAAQEQSPVSLLDANVASLGAFQNATTLMLHTMGKPTVAMVNGHAVGAGLSLALACDIRVASDKAKFGTAFRNVGFSGDFGGSYFLQRLVGPAKAKELYFTAEIIDAETAASLGMVNRVVPHDRLEEETMALAAALAAGPTAAYARMKQNFNLGAHSDLKTLLDQEALNMVLSGMSGDSLEAIRAFIEKREPKFRGE